MSSGIFKNSIIVAAHPDDEILWFSSLLNEVDHVLLCFLGEKVNPAFGQRRKKALPKIQFGHKLSCLEIVSLGMTRPRSFLSPKFYQNGIELKNENDEPDKFNDPYKENFYKLRDKLAIKLAGYQNVITHNPWGEYGHIEHVQVYRVVKDLQESMDFDIWYSNYCSTRTIKLINPMLNASESVKFSTNTEIAKAAMSVYKDSGCWTWFEDWDWAKEEIFFKESKSDRGIISVGTMFSLNFVVMPKLNSRLVFSGSFLERIKNKISHFFSSIMRILPML